MSYRRFRMSGYYTSGRKVHPVAGPAMKYAGRMFRAAITTANVTGGIAPTVAAGPISFAGYVRAFCVALGRLPTHWSKDRASTATRRWNTRKATTKVTSRPSRCTALALSLPWRRWATTLKSGNPPQTTRIHLRSEADCDKPLKVAALQSASFGWRHGSADLRRWRSC